MSITDKMNSTEIREALLSFKQKFSKKPAFNRYHSKRYLRVKSPWRKPRGLDNRCRKKVNGMPMMPGKRFKKPAVIRNLLPNGYYEVVVYNINDLEAIHSLNDKFCATIGGAVSAKNRINLVNKAKMMGIVLTNEHGRLMEAIDE
ncbi:RL32 [Hepatospora eriocheir]|uniref:RL32 n=1 Tax=Hepatospora eriocheir TaxID=1081669 RepID=A0A1X0QA88_9MICR|nr:RL32 [Hepatospora eriocheir]